MTFFPLFLKVSQWSLRQAERESRKLQKKFGLDSSESFALLREEIELLHERSPKANSFA